MNETFSEITSVYVSGRGYVPCVGVEDHYGSTIAFLFDGSCQVAICNEYGWVRTQRVGQYDDWQIRQRVTLAASVLGVDITSLQWYSEENDR